MKITREINEKTRKLVSEKGRNRFFFSLVNSLNFKYVYLLYIGMLNNYIYFLGLFLSLPSL